jgi:MFS family permease
MGYGRYTDILKDGNFLRFWFSTLSADLGYSMFELGVTWLVISISRSAAITGAVLFVEFTAYSLTAAIGPFIDASANKKAFIVRIFPIQAGIAVAVTVLIIIHAITVPLLLLIAFIMAILWDFPWLAQSAILQTIMKRERLLQANSLMQAFGGGSTVFINALAGFVIAVAGVQGISAIYAIAFLISAAGMTTVRVPVNPNLRRDKPQFLAALKDGWRFVMKGQRKDLRELFFVSGIQGFFSVAPLLLITVTAFIILKGNVVEYGILNGLLLAGGFAGNFIFGKINPTKSIGKVLLLSMLIDGALIAVSPLAALNTTLLDVLWFSVGCFDPIFYNGYNSYIYATVDSDHVARVKGNVYLLRGLGRGAGNLVLGVVILYFGIFSGAVSFGLSLIILTVLLLFTGSKMRVMGYS